MSAAVPPGSERVCPYPDPQPGSRNEFWPVQGSTRKYTHLPAKADFSEYLLQTPSGSQLPKAARSLSGTCRAGVLGAIGAGSGAPGRGGSTKTVARSVNRGAKRHRPGLADTEPDRSEIDPEVVAPLGAASGCLGKSLGGEIDIGRLDTYTEHRFGHEFPTKGHDERARKRSQQLGEALWCEPPKIPRMGVDREEHDRTEEQDAPWSQHPVHLLYGPDGIADMLERVQRQERAHRVTVEGQGVHILDAIHPGPGLNVATYELLAREQTPQVERVFLAFSRTGSDLHDGA